MRDRGLEPVVFHDIDGDRNVEVLFVSEPWSAASRGLFCLDHRCKVRFHYQPPHTVSFGEKTYGPPWRGAFVLATGEMGRPRSDNLCGHCPLLATSPLMRRRKWR